jgi:maltose-binding protein MalE
MVRDSLDRRTALAGIGSLTASVSLSGCTGRISGLVGGNSGPATLWHNFPNKPIDGSGPSQTKTIVEQFAQYREANPESKVAVKRVANNYEQRLGTGLPEGEGPHSFSWAHRTLGTYQGRGLLYDNLDADTRLDLDLTPEDAFLDVAVAAAQFRSFLGGADDRAEAQQLYGLPSGGVTVALAYNTEYVESPPETTSEWTDDMDSFESKDSSNDGVVCPGSPYHVSAWARAFGGDYYDDSAGEFTFTDDAVVEGIEYYRNKIWPHQPQKPALQKQFKQFEKGNAAYAVATPREFRQLDDAVDADVRVTTLPAMDGESDAEPSPYATVYLWYFSRLLEPNETKRATTLDVLEWLTTTESAIATNATEHGIVPVTSTVPEDVDEDHPMRTYYEMIKTGAPEPSHPDRAEVWTTLQETLETILTKDTDVGSELQDARENVES